MTPLPKRRWSTRRQGKRRASIKLQLPQLTTCKNCGQSKRSHSLCANCNQ
ncbi:TPA: 50S ribosomal protein L32 [Candidatus Collierbacteria bacterium]|nr:50S ribosomal protein L32 [Candidatus Collierbacteria bacterium]HBO10486.1 50S ribosomal protein L32 [Candidatus Collierbacteria bacterium]